MKWSFDDRFIGKTETGTSLRTRDVPRPTGLTNREWYRHAGEVTRLLNAPIPMVLHCPACHAQHIDEPHGDWTNPPHKSHECQQCKTVWRTADVPTAGVVAVGTRGKVDTWPKVITPASLQHSEAEERLLRLLSTTLVSAPLTMADVLSEHAMPKVAWETMRATVAQALADEYGSHWYTADITRKTMVWEIWDELVARKLVS